jgi:hypothetical protein
MRALKAAVIFMGVLIVAGVALIAVVLMQRLGSVPSGPVQATLDEPTGTRIAGVALASERVAVQLQGGGPDRVAVLDLRSGRVLARLGLSR